MPDSFTFPYRKIVVTGGAGFLGKHLVKKMSELAGVEVFVPRKSEYDLVRSADVERLFNDSSPDCVIHLAAVVGGIGHNKNNPGRFFYDNLMMGAHLIENARLNNVSK